MMLRSLVMRGKFGQASKVSENNDLDCGRTTSDQLLHEEELCDEEGITITNTFQKFLHESGRKPSKTWVNKCRKICNRSVKSWLQDNNIELYLTHKENLLLLKDLLEP